MIGKFLRQLRRNTKIALQNIFGITAYPCTEVDGFIMPAVKAQQEDQLFCSGVFHIMPCFHLFLYKLSFGEENAHFHCALDEILSFGGMYVSHTAGPDTDR